MKQERITHDRMQEARELAAVERELKIEKRVYVSFYKRTPFGTLDELLFRYDLPREMWLRYQWVINWRQAKLICRYPRERIYNSLSFYDRSTGEELGFGTLLSKLTSAKAWVTRCERRTQEYIEENRKNNLFFEEQTDEMLLKALSKLEQKRQKVKSLERELHERIIQKNSHE